MKLKSLFVAALAAFAVSSGVYALDHTSIAKDYDNLPDSVKAEIAKTVMAEKERVAKKAAKAAEESGIVAIEKAKEVAAAAPEKAFDYAAKGAEIGRALASATKELGVAADNFLNSTTGKLAAAVIVYKLVGQDLVHFLAGSTIFCVLVPMWFYMYRRKFHIVTRECEPVEVKLLWIFPWTFNKGKTVTQYNQKSDGFDEFLFYIALGFIVVFSVVIAL